MYPPGIFPHLLSFLLLDRSCFKSTIHKQQHPACGLEGFDFGFEIDFDFDFAFDFDLILILKLILKLKLILILILILI